MLVSFNPSLSIPNVNRKNPDKTSFQKRLPQVEIDKITANSHAARCFTTNVLKGVVTLANDAKEQLREMLGSLKPDVAVYIKQAL